MTVLLARTRYRAVGVRDRAVVAVYRISGGRLLRTWRGIPVLLLTTIGRHGQGQRTDPVCFDRDGKDRLLIIGIDRRGQDAPAWAGNLRAEPWARIEIGREIAEVLVRPTSAAQRERLWRRMCRRYPGFIWHGSRIDPSVPVFLLEPVR